MNLTRRKKRGQKTKEKQVRKSHEEKTDFWAERLRSAGQAVLPVSPNLVWGGSWEADWERETQKRKQAMGVSWREG
jgi:hypothetical protein